MQNIAKDEFERNFVSALVAHGEIGVKFDDIGALEHVKKTLNELVILPMRMTELFTRGNLLRIYSISLHYFIFLKARFFLDDLSLFVFPRRAKAYCYLVLLVLVRRFAKALATEAGANFISITSSSLTSKVT